MDMPHESNLRSEVFKIYQQSSKSLIGHIFVEKNMYTVQLLGFVCYLRFI